MVLTLFGLVLLFGGGGLAFFGDWAGLDLISAFSWGRWLWWA